MTLSLLIPPEVEPVTLAEAKVHLRVEHALEDELIRTYVVAARELVEAETARALLEQTWELALSGFSCACLLLPRPPLLGVVEVRYLDSAGVDHVWASSEYEVEIVAGPHARHGLLRPGAGKSWPATQITPRAVRVVFRAGYGADLPASLKAAVLLAAEDFYERRDVGVAVHRLIAPFRVDLGA